MLVYFVNFFLTPTFIIEPKNIGNRPLKVYSIYAPPQHPFGTVHKTKQDAERAEKH